MPEPLRVIEGFACTGCGCVCDDLRLAVRGERIVAAEGACALAEPWLLAQGAASPPAAEVAGEAATFDLAVERAAELLGRAHQPLVYGLARSSTEGQAAAVALAEALGAVIDTTASLCHAPSVVAQQQVGKVTCTLGEVRNRADAVVFWGSDPLVSHPRHWERYSVFPQGRFVPRGRRDRFVAVADVSRTASADAADFFLPVEPGRHFEALAALRAVVEGGAAPEGQGAPAAGLAELAGRLRAARFGVMFFGVGLAAGEAGHCNVQALLELVARMNVPARWCAMRMRVQGNVVGADTVLGWQTGYPFAVSLSRGHPRYNPGEFSVQGVLQRGDADACLLVGSETLSWASAEAVAHLRRIPVVVLDAPGVESMVEPAVRFRTATPGVHLGGTAYRMDGVPVPLRAALPARYPGDEVVLGRIRERVSAG